MAKFSTISLQTRNSSSMKLVRASIEKRWRKVHQLKAKRQTNWIWSAQSPCLNPWSFHKRILPKSLNQYYKITSSLLSKVSMILRNLAGTVWKELMKRMRRYHPIKTIRKLPELKINSRIFSVKTQTTYNSNKNNPKKIKALWNS